MGYMGSLILSDDVWDIKQLLGRNIPGEEKIMYALTKVRGIGRRFANLICKKGEIDLSKRAGEFTDEQMQKLREIVAKPLLYKIPRWFLNNQKEYRNAEYSQVTGGQLDSLLQRTKE